MSSSETANAPSSSSDACFHTFGISARLPEPSTHERTYSTSAGSPVANASDAGAPVSGSAE